MKIPESKTSKILRIITAIIYVFQVYFLTCSFVGDVIDGENKYYTCFDLIFRMATSGLGDSYRNLALISCLFAIFPILGFFIFIFDRQRNFKNIFGIVTSIFEVVLICFGIGPAYLQMGSLLSMFGYLVILFLSMLGIFSRFVKPQDRETRRKRTD